jgi:FkbM family methyltransferase
MKMSEFSSIWDGLKRRYDREAQSEMHRRVFMPDSKVVIFGAGEVARLLLPLLKRYQKKPFAYCDNYKTGIHAETNLPILSPAQLVARHCDSIVLIAASSAKISDAMFDQLLKIGFPQSNVFRSYGDAFMSVEYFQEKYMTGYEWAYDFFRDSESKNIIAERVKGHLFGFDMNPLPYWDIYFPKDIGFELSDNEIFVDGGAYDGATSVDFARRTSNKYRKIYAFEPDLINYRETGRNLSAYSGVEITNAGLWRKAGELTFSSGCGQASRIDDEAVNKIRVVSLDEMFAERPEGEFPTFIKMDIEGAEHAAIEGAKEIIGSRRPKLAISAYHKPEDIYDLPRLIYDMNPDYRFALRHYTKGCLETVLYAF